MKHLAVQKQQRTERLILCRRADFSVDRQVGQIPPDFVTAHLRRVPLPVKHDEPADPRDVGFFSPATVVPNPHRRADSVEQLWLPRLRIASVHRVLERLRAAMNWGIAQTPPLFTKSPFHRFGVRLNKKAEIVRDRRVSRDEEKRLLDTALGVMNTAAHRHVGERLHDRIVGALELCCRRGECC